jgi:hypothetical protein
MLRAKHALLNLQRLGMERRNLGKFAADRIPVR